MRTIKRFKSTLSNLFACSLWLLAGTVLSGCTTYETVVYPPNADTSDLAQLRVLRQVQMEKSDDNSESINSMRLLALHQTALTVGAQGALAKRSQELNALFKSQAPRLDQVFNFNLMMLSHNVLPPVLTEGDDTLNLQDPNTIRAADRTYAIVSQAHFVTVPPTWRDYLHMSYKKPDVPDKTLLPKNVAEVVEWKLYVQKGWEEGTLQADNIFIDSLNRLTRDYTGMALYRSLYNQKMISAPFVAKANLGITGGGDNLTINDSVLRITSIPQLNTEGKTWTPAVRQPQ
jgi:defect-in-organelle-trafficking protein DotC